MPSTRSRVVASAATVIATSGSIAQPPVKWSETDDRAEAEILDPADLVPPAGTGRLSAGIETVKRNGRCVGDLVLPECVRRAAGDSRLPRLGRRRWSGSRILDIRRRSAAPSRFRLTRLGLRPYRDRRPRPTADYRRRPHDGGVLRLPHVRRRASEKLFAGDLFVYSPTPHSTALVDFAREMAEDAFAPHFPPDAQHHLAGPGVRRRAGRAEADLHQPPAQQGTRPRASWPTSASIPSTPTSTCPGCAR